jgi:hypothetical protein
MEFAILALPAQALMTPTRPFPPRRFELSEEIAPTTLETAKAGHSLRATSAGESWRLAKLAGSLAR